RLPREGHGHQRRRAHLFARGGERGARPPGVAGEGGDRRTRRGVGRGGDGGGGAQVRAFLERGGDHRPLPQAHRELQVPAQGGVPRRTAAVGGGQDHEERVA